MIRSRRSAVVVAGLGLAAALALGLLPQSYTHTSIGVTVDCGNFFSPKNPTPPPDTNEECDGVHVARGAMVIAAALAGIAGGGAVLVAGRLRRREA